MKRLTLTFDNGPVAGVTEPVLETLARHAVQAVFFVIGERAAAADGKRLVRATLDAGHRVGGHTWTHSVPFGELDDDSVRREIDDTVALLDDLGADSLLLRPYASGGVMDDRMMSSFGAAHLQAIGATCVSWSSVPGDWLDPRGWVQGALDDVDRQPWPVVVLHDVPDAAADRLGDFLAAVEDRNIEYRLDFPAECTHIDHGRATATFDALRSEQSPTDR